MGKNPYAKMSPSTQSTRPSIQPTLLYEPQLQYESQPTTNQNVSPLKNEAASHSWTDPLQQATVANTKEDYHSSLPPYLGQSYLQKSVQSTEPSLHGPPDMPISSADTGFNQSIPTSPYMAVSQTFSSRVTKTQFSDNKYNDRGADLNNDDVDGDDDDIDESDEISSGSYDDDDDISSNEDLSFGIHRSDGKGNVQMLG